MEAQPTSPTSRTGVAAGASAAGGEQDLWSSILDSVSGSRGVVTRNCIVLGGSKTGKSTLISRLSSRTGEAPPRETGHETTTARDNTAALDLGLSYSVLDVGDENDGETLARLGVYQLPSPSPPFPSLLNLALSRTTLLDSLVIITLDWEKPWLLLGQMKAWMGVLERLVGGGGKGKAVGEGWEGQEARDRLEAHLRGYAEPPLPGSTAAIAPSVALPDTDGPLPQGVLTNNLGLQIVFVCTKSDYLDREKRFKEEQFDYVQQTLRTIALRYGAAIFFTSHLHSTSFAKLRAYILHRLFAQSSSSPPAVVDPSAPSPAAAAPSRSFPFPHRANVVDRDDFLIPTGWDTWGKIVIPQERFDVRGTGEAWEAEMEGEREGASVENGEMIQEEVERRARGLVAQFEAEAFVVSEGVEGITNPMAESRVNVEDEQLLLKTYSDALAKEREKDPRAAFAVRPNADGASGFGASLVGPMGSAGMNLASVEKAMGRDREGDNEGPSSAAAAAAARRASAVSMARQNSTQSNRTTSPALSPNLGSAPTFSSLSERGTGSANTSPHLGALQTPGTPGSTGSGSGQNEILANFFNNLLAARSTGSTPVSASAGATAAAGTRAPSSTTSGLSPTLPQAARAPGMGSRSHSQQSSGEA